MDVPIQPSSQRLNPKLTRRNLAINLPHGSEGNEKLDSERSNSEESSDGTSRSTSTSSSTVTADSEKQPPIEIPRTNPRLHLIHNGRWIPKVYDYGRLRPRTGIWDCCGHPEHLSLYCASEERRIEYRKEIDAEKKRQVDEQNARIARKQYLLEQIQLIESNPVSFENYDHNNNIELPPPKVKEAALTEEELLEQEQAILASDPMEVALSKSKPREAPKEIVVKDPPPQSSSVSALVPVAVAESAATDLPPISESLNAPMMMQFLLRRFHEDPTVLKGLEFVLHHLDRGEGCQLFMRHGLVNLLYRAAEFHHRNTKILLLVLQCFRQLLDCNLTRDEIIIEQDCQQTIVRLIFNIVYLNMTSMDHIEAGVRALMQCTRYSLCRDHVVEQQVIPYLLILARKYLRHQPPYFLNSLLKIFHWMCTDVDRAKFLLDLKVLKYCYKIVKAHSRHRLVLIPAIALFRKIILLIPATLEWMLENNIAAMIISSLEVVYDNEEIQLEALKLLQIISMTSKGWQQISSIKGAWQRICQGTEKGDSLVHDLAGDFQNPGWVLSETPYLPLLERLKLSAYENQKTSLELKPKAAWTSASLRQYMGLSMTGQSLAINTEFQELFFQLLTTLDMLPKEEEQREHWFIRVRNFEKENEVKLEEMVHTVQEMRRRDAIQKKLASQRLQVGGSGPGDSDFTGMTVKEIFVAGKKIDGKFLAENDIDLEEAFYAML